MCARVRGVKKGGLKSNNVARREKLDMSSSLASLVCPLVGSEVRASWRCSCCSGRD